MTELQWTFTVLAGFCLTFTAIKAWNKDVIGALQWVIAILLICGALIGVSGCVTSPEQRPWMEVGLANDFPKTVGSNPACVVRVRKPVVPGKIIFGYEHHSSCRDLDDRHTIDQLELMFIIPLGRK